MDGLATLDAIFPSVRAGLLSTALLEPRRWWFLSELARRLRVTPSSLQRELESLVNAEILLRRQDGRRVYFRANDGSPIFTELRGLVEKTSGIAPSLAQALEAFADRIDFAFIYGSFARGQEHASSDVDVMIAGVVEQIDLVPALRKLEDRLGREVNVTLYSPQEFRAKAAAGDHFLCSVLKNRTILLKGSRNELDSMVTRRKTSPAPDQRPGARRNPSSRGARSR